jgi:hypothetical protein
MVIYDTVVLHSFTFNRPFNPFHLISQHPSVPMCSSEYISIVMDSPQLLRYSS